MWIAIDRLLVIWKSDQTRFLPSCGCDHTTVWMHHLDSSKMHGEKARWELHKNALCCFEQILEATPYKTADVQPLLFYKPSKYDEKDMQS